MSRGFRTIKRLGDVVADAYRLPRTDRRAPPPRATLSGTAAFLRRLFMRFTRQ
jgi:hypothetical protein